MKKLIFAALLAVFGLTSAFAQQSGQRMSPEERMKREVDSLTKNLSLSPEQVTKVTPIIQSSQKKLTDVMTQMRESGSFDRDKMNAERTKINTEKDQQLKAVLTPEQAEKLVVYRKKEQEMRSQRPMGPGNR